MSGHEMRMAYELSRIEYTRDDDTKKANDLVESGKFVIVNEFVVHCPRTDAIMTSEIFIEKVFDTWEEAAAWLSGYYSANPEPVDESSGPHLYRDPRPTCKYCGKIGGDCKDADCLDRFPPDCPF